MSIVTSNDSAATSLHTVLKNNKDHSSILYISNIIISDTTLDLLNKTPAVSSLTQCTSHSNIL